MHICIPDTREVRPQHGASYLLYNVHIDGLYHCSLRFKQLLHLHQALCKKFNSSPSASNGASLASNGRHYYHSLPPFPPKRLLPLSASRVEERRQQLEKYLQTISQDKTIANSTIFNMFLLEAQRESTKLVESERHVHLEIELVNGQKIKLPIVTHDSVDSVLTACCRALGLDDKYHAYFCLCLCGYDVVRDKLIIKRKLSFFEAPFITLQMAIQQQEQLQNVLSTTSQSQMAQPAAASTVDNNNNYYNRITNFTSATNGAHLRYDPNSTPCHCLSCSSQQQQVQRKLSSTTGVPLVSSSSNGYQSYVDQSQQHHPVSNNHLHYNSSETSNSQSWRPSRPRSDGSPFVTHRILLRKSYWDPIYDSYILNDQQALNLLFIQTVYDMKHSLMFVDRETYQQLESLLANDSKLEYILLARTLKYYNYVHFEPCYSDYPRPRTKVMISIGSKELNMRVLKRPRQHSDDRLSSNGAQGTSSAQHHQQRQEPVLYCTSSLLPNGYQHLITKDDLIEEEYNFKVPLIRCWRLTSLETLNSTNQQQHRLAVATTLAGGKRKSLSLFNSVLGNANSSSSASRANCACNNTNGTQQQPDRLEGFGGQSLVATLVASGDSNNNQAATRRSSNASIGSNSFFNFRSNGNQSNGSSDGDTSLVAHHSSQQTQQSVNNELAPEPNQLSQYELSFEYLIAKDTLKWITISSDQAIFISISLQGVVDELVSKRELGACLDDFDAGLAENGIVAGRDPRTHQPLVSRPIAIRHRQPDEGNKQLSESFTYMCQDGGQRLIKSKSQQMLDRFCAGSPLATASNYNATMARRYKLASSGGSSFMVSAHSQSSSSIFQAIGLCDSRDTNGLSSSGRQLPATTSGFNGHGSFSSPTSSFEISQFNKKVPSPIINDAFEGVVTNDDDL